MECPREDDAHHARPCERITRLDPPRKFTFLAAVEYIGNLRQNVREELLRIFSASTQTKYASYPAFSASNNTEVYTLLPLLDQRKCLRQLHSTFTSKGPEFQGKVRIDKLKAILSPCVLDSSFFGVGSILLDCQ